MIICRRIALIGGETSNAGALGRKRREREEGGASSGTRGKKPKGASGRRANAGARIFLKKPADGRLVQVGKKSATQSEKGGRKGGKEVLE